MDRCWSVAVGQPCGLTDDIERGTQIDTPWPLTIIEYEKVHQQLISYSRFPDLISLQSNQESLNLAFASSGRTVFNLSTADPSTMQSYAEGSSLALRAVASALFGRSAWLTGPVLAGVILFLFIYSLMNTSAADPPMN